MDARFPFSTRLNGDWDSAKSALRDGLDAMGSAINAGYGTFTSDIVLPAGTLTFKTGTWKPLDVSGASLSYTTAFAFEITNRYVRLGPMVFIHGSVGVPATGSGAEFRIGGLPFAIKGGQSANSPFEHYALSAGYTTQGTSFTVLASSDRQAIVCASSAGAVLTNANFSGKVLEFSGWYITSAS